MVTESTPKLFDTPLIPEEDPNIYYPDSDDEPMSENDRQRRALIDTSEALIQRYRDRPDVYVSADMFIYYEMNNNERAVSPDVFVSFGVSDHLRRSYFVWREGKAPDFVLEVASPGTWQRDAGPKRDIYAAIGVREYWRFDPERGVYFRPPLIGERLDRQGRYQPLPLSEPDGILRGYSPVLGLDLCVRDDELRLYDPLSRTWLPTLREATVSRQLAEQRAESAEVRAEFAEVRAESAEARARLLERLLHEHGIPPPAAG